MKTEFAKNEIPFYGTIGKTGICTIEYEPFSDGSGTITGRRESYTKETFKICPKDMLILDCRAATDSDIMYFIMRYDSPSSLSQLAGKKDQLQAKLDEYIKTAKKYGYCVYTVDRLLKSLNDEN